MIVGFDVETYGEKDGLPNAQNFLFGKVVCEEKSNVFFNKKDCWNGLKALAFTEKEQGRNLYVYGHNVLFDFYSIIPHKEEELRILCKKPPIIKYQNMWILDTHAIGRCSLRELGEAVGKPKMVFDVTNLPKDINSMDFEQRAKLIEYCERDALIPVLFIKMVKEYTKQDGSPIRTPMSAGQIGINYIRRYISNDIVLAEALMDDVQRRTIKIQQAHALCRKANRTGYTILNRYGIIEEVTAVDVHSLYPKAATEVEVPQIDTEEVIFEPTKDDILHNNLWGAATVLVKKPEGRSFLPVKTSAKGKNIYPKNECHILGTYTLEKLRYMNTLPGYEVIHVFEAVTYKPAAYGLAGFFEKYYQRRKAGKFEKIFYKNIMNYGIQKFAYEPNPEEYRIVEMEEIENTEDIADWTEDGKTIIKRIKGEKRITPYYCPIIPATICARARVKMDRAYKLIPEEDFIYSNNDSVFFIGDHLKKFKIGTEMGEWEIKHEKQRMVVYGKNNYMIGSHVVVSGIPAWNITPETFENGKVIIHRMRSLKAGIEKAGTFTKTHINLEKGMDEETEEEVYPLYVNHAEKTKEYLRECERYI